MKSPRAETAEAILTTHIPVAAPEEKVSDVRARLIRDIISFRTINYIYILSPEKKLLGVLSVKDLHRANPDALVGSICKKPPLITIRPETHQERVAYLALKNSLKAIPVVNSDNTFLGSIPSDTILAILYKETHEDILRLAGIRHPKALAANILETSLFTFFRHRVPWLFLGLLGGLLAARVIGLFENTLRENVVLAAFIPLIVYMSDAVGTQTEAWVIRDLAIEQRLPFRKYFLRHLLVTAMIACSFGIALYLMSAVLYGNPMAMVLGLSLTAAITSSVLTGLIVPFAFSRMHLDPADPSGPVGTILQDILSILAYFLIASVLL